MLFFATECLELSSYRKEKEIIKLSGIAGGFGILLLIIVITAYIVLRKRRNRQTGSGIIIKFHYIFNKIIATIIFEIVYVYFF